MRSFCFGGMLGPYPRAALFLNSTIEPVRAEENSLTESDLKVLPRSWQPSHGSDLRMMLESGQRKLGDSVALRTSIGAPAC